MHSQKLTRILAWVLTLMMLVSNVSVAMADTDAEIAHDHDHEYEISDLLPALDLEQPVIDGGAVTLPLIPGEFVIELPEVETPDEDAPEADEPTADVETEADESADPATDSDLNAGGSTSGSTGGNVADDEEADEDADVEEDDQDADVEDDDDDWSLSDMLASIGLAGYSADDIMVLALDGECPTGHRHVYPDYESEQLTDFVKESDTRHSATFDTYTFGWCSDCGQPVFRVQTGKGVTLSLQHEFDNEGVCYGCGFTNVCQHPEQYLYYSYHTQNPEGGRKYAYVDGTYHTYTAEVVESARCLRCRTDLKDKPTGEIVKVTAEHSDWNGDGLCDYCEQKAVPCAHDTTYYIDDPFYNDVKPKDETFHTVLVGYRRHVYCAKCGELLKEEFTSKSDELLEPHDFYGNDTCYCGYDGKCTHPRAYLRYDAVTLRYEPNADGKTHTRIYKLYKRTYCPDCYTDIDEEVLVEENIKEESEHEVSGSGLCYLCGYGIVCAHEELSYALETTSVNGTGRYIYTDNGDGTHTYYQDVYKVTSCAICGRTMSRVRIATNVAVTYQHWINEAGYCTANGCGYYADCKHTNTKLIADNYQYQYAGLKVVAKDDAFHTVTYVPSSHYVCLDCGKTLESMGTVYGEAITVKESHQWAWEEYDYCTVCGYAKPESSCKHTNTTSYFNSWVVGQAKDTGDGKHHTVTTKTVLRTYCADCYETISEEVVAEGLTSIMSHDWNWDSDFDIYICRDCGYVTECKHTNISYQSYVNTYGQPTSVDKYTHTMLASVTTYKYCSDCWKNFDYKTSSIAEGTYPHSFSTVDNYRYCYNCGYTEELVPSTCKHEKTRTGESYDSYSKVVSNGASGHTLTVNNKVRYTYCNACGKRVKSELVGQNVEMKYSHSFSNGVCTVCGYVNTCAHTNLVNYDYVNTYTSHGIKYLNQRQHTLVGDIYRRTSCKDCGEVISDVLYAANSPFNEDHAWTTTDGRTWTCAYCGAETTDYYLATGDKRPSSSKAAEEVAEINDLISALKALAEENTGKTLKIVGADELLTETEYATLETLNLDEAALVILSAIGKQDQVDAAVAAKTATLSDDAKALADEVVARAAGLSDDDKVGFNSTIVTYFPTVFGMTTMRVDVDGTVTRYNFSFDATSNLWMLY